MFNGTRMTRIGRMSTDKSALKIRLNPSKSVSSVFYFLSINLQLNDSIQSPLQHRNPA